MVALDPVFRHQDVRLRADLLRTPTHEIDLEVEARVAYWLVDLPDRVLGHKTTGLRQRMAEYWHGQRRTDHHRKHPADLTSSRLRD